MVSSHFQIRNSTPSLRIRFKSLDLSSSTEDSCTPSSTSVARQASSVLDGASSLTIDGACVFEAALEARVSVRLTDFQTAPMSPTLPCKPSIRQVAELIVNDSVVMASLERSTIARRHYALG